MKHAHVTSSAHDSQEAAYASLEALAHGMWTGGKTKVTTANVYEVDGFWYADATIEEEDPEIDERAEPAPVRDDAPEEKEQVILSAAVLWHSFVPSLREDAISPVLAEIHPEPLIHPKADIGPDFREAETDHGLIPVVENVMELAMQEILAHNARLADEYPALRRKVYEEELKSLRPHPEQDLRPEPGIAA